MKLEKLTFQNLILNQSLRVKVTTKDGINLFDWVQLKNHPKAKEILAYLKILKSHEVTHRILESAWIKERVAVKLKDWTTKIFTQEHIAEIIDWSRKATQDELIGLEKALQKELWERIQIVKKLKNWHRFHKKIWHQASCKK